MENVEPLADRVRRVLGDANPGALARIDQHAGTWRDYFLEGRVDLADELASKATLRALTLTYGMMLAAHAEGQVDSKSFGAFADIVAVSTAAIVLARRM